MSLRWYWRTAGSTGSFLERTGKDVWDPLQSITFLDEILTFTETLGGAERTQEFSMLVPRGIVPPRPGDEIYFEDDELSPTRRMFAGLVCNTRAYDYQTGASENDTTLRAQVIVKLEGYERLLKGTKIQRNFLETKPRAILLDVIANELSGEIDGSTSTMDDLGAATTLILEGSRGISAWELVQRLAQETDALYYVDFGPGASTGKANLYFVEPPSAANAPFGLRDRFRAATDSASEAYDDSTWEANEDGCEIVNKITVYGGIVEDAIISATAEDLTSQGTYGIREASLSYPDEYDTTRLQAIADNEILRKKAPSKSVRCTIQAWGLEVGQRVRIRNHAAAWFDENLVLRSRTTTYKAIKEGAYEGDTLRIQDLEFGDRDLAAEAELARNDRIINGAASGVATAVKLRMPELDSTDYMDFPRASQTQDLPVSGGEMSISMWIKPASVAGGTALKLISNQNTWDLVQVGTLLRLDLINELQAQVSGYTLVADELVHVVCIFNGTASLAGVSWYINGVSYGSAGTTSGGSMGSDAGLPMNICREWDGTDHWPGRIAMLAIWDEALGDQDAARLYSAGPTEQNILSVVPSALVHFSPFNETAAGGSVPTTSGACRDRSSYANHGDYNGIMTGREELFVLR